MSRVASLCMLLATLVGIRVPLSGSDFTYGAHQRPSVADEHEHLPPGLEPTLVRVEHQQNRGGRAKGSLHRADAAQPHLVLRDGGVREAAGAAARAAARATAIARAADGTALSGPIFTVLTVLSWIYVGIHMCKALPSPVCA